MVDNDALAYMRGRALAGYLIARLRKIKSALSPIRGPGSTICARSPTALKVNADPVQIATEGACGAPSRRMVYSPTP